MLRGSIMKAIEFLWKKECQCCSKMLIYILVYWIKNAAAILYILDASYFITWCPYMSVSHGDGWASIDCITWFPRGPFCQFFLFNFKISHFALVFQINSPMNSVSSTEDVKPPLGINGMLKMPSHSSNCPISLTKHICAICGDRSSGGCLFMVSLVFLACTNTLVDHSWPLGRFARPHLELSFITPLKGCTVNVSNISCLAILLQPSWFWRLQLCLFMQRTTGLLVLERLCWLLKYSDAQCTRLWNGLAQLAPVAGELPHGT